jgi:ATP-dependent protease ClpP protease subunit
MFHRAKGSFRGQFEDGEVEQQLAMWKQVVRKMEQMNADRVGLTLAQYKSKVINEWWIYGKDSIKQKVADKVTDFECSNVLLKERRTVSIDSFFGKIEFEESACPLVN